MINELEEKIYKLETFESYLSSIENLANLEILKSELKAIIPELEKKGYTNGNQ